MEAAEYLMYLVSDICPLNGVLAPKAVKASAKSHVDIILNLHWLTCSDETEVQRTALCRPPNLSTCDCRGITGQAPSILKNMCKWSTLIRRVRAHLQITSSYFQSHFVDCSYSTNTQWQTESWQVFVENTRKVLGNKEYLTGSSRVHLPQES